MNDLAMKSRDAVPEDASAACQVMQRSIAELCLIDHRNDPVILERWLSDKTPEIFKSWIRPGNALLVAIEDGNILAVGRVTDAGEITLNYVSLDARFRGVSTKLLTALERRAIERGNQGCTLKSTETARCTSPEAIRKMNLRTVNSAPLRVTRCQNVWSLEQFE
jgi:hypothetical protein